MTSEIIKVPDLGGADSVELIELSVAVGDDISEGDTLVVLESDKASMEIPSPVSGKVLKLLVKEGDTLQQDSPIIELEVAGASAPAKAAEAAPSPVEASAPVSAPDQQAVNDVPVPDIGSDAAVEVIDICVQVGDDIAEGDSLIVLESDKASMEVPAPYAGKVMAVLVKVGDKITQGQSFMQLQGKAPVAAAPVGKAPETAPAPVQAEPAAEKPDLSKIDKFYQPVTNMTASRPSGDVYAGPAVRRMAREVGLDLANVTGSGPHGRIQKADVKAHIKQALANPASAAGSAIPAVPGVDFAEFGEVSIEPMSKLHKITADNMHRSWLNVPHVTAFDEVDITELEDFRNSLKKEAEQQGVKITPLPFILKACAIALKANPKVNASIGSDGQSIVYKHYVHIGMAVDTPAGLMVPVIRDVDKKSIFELAKETAELAQKAKDRKLTPNEMKGGSFTISSLGAMGGTGFTPIVNTPESAILGVSKLDIKPRWDGKQFVPRKMLPISLSYDHKMVNGADAGRFMVLFNQLLSDVRRLAL